MALGAAAGRDGAASSKRAPFPTGTSFQTKKMLSEESRRIVITQQAGTVKRAIAAANDIAQRDLRRRRIGLVLFMLLFFSAWRLVRPGRAPNSDPATAQLLPRRTVAYSRDLHSVGMLNASGLEALWETRPRGQRRRRRAENAADIGELTQRNASQQNESQSRGPSA